MNNSSIIIENDAALFGILLIILGLIFYTSNLKSSFWKKFYTFFPVILMCYFIPSLLNTTGVVSPEKSNLYFVASRYLLPTSLVLLTLSVDLKEIGKLGSKALIMFFTGTIGIIIGGPIAILLVINFFPSLVAISPEELARGMSTIAGSWIGGGANQTAMKEVFNVDGDLFSKMVTVDVLVGNALLAVLLIGAARAVSIDKFLNANSDSVEKVKKKIEKYNLSIARIPNLTELIYILSIGFGVTGICHLIADSIAPFILTNFANLQKYSLTSSFFWLIVMSTTFGVILSFSKLRNLEGAGASKIGSIFFNLKLSDILYTFVICNTKKTKELNLKSKDFGYCVELPIKIQRKNFTYTDIASHERVRHSGEKKVNAAVDGFKILSKMIKLFFNRKI